MENNEQENINSQNDEQETLDSSNEENVDESEQSEESTNEPEYTENEKKLYARLKKAEKELKAEKERKNEKKDSDKPESTEDLTIARLEARGILDPKDQADVLRFAKAEGVSAVEALEDEFVKAKLDFNKKQRTSAQATPKGNNRSNNTVDEVDLYVRRYKEKGPDALPENNPRLVSAVLRKLRNGA